MTVEPTPRTSWNESVISQASVDASDSHIEHLIEKCAWAFFKTGNRAVSQENLHELHIINHLVGIRRSQWLALHFFSRNKHSQEQKLMLSREIAAHVSRTPPPDRDFLIAMETLWQNRIEHEHLEARALERSRKSITPQASVDTLTRGVAHRIIAITGDRDEVLSLLDDTEEHWSAMHFAMVAMYASRNLPKTLGREVLLRALSKDLGDWQILQTDVLQRAMGLWEESFRDALDRGKKRAAQRLLEELQGLAEHITGSAMRKHLHAFAYCVLAYCTYNAGDRQKTGMYLTEASHHLETADPSVLESIKQLEERYRAMENG